VPPERAISPEEAEAQFARGLDNLVEIAEKLEPFCESVREMIEIADLARGNKGQLRLIMREVLANPNPQTRRNVQHAG
jgi:hypothetical protein